MDAKQLVAQMTLEEKASLCSGLDNWRLKGVARLGLSPVAVADGPHGLRKENGSGPGGLYDSVPATCFPAACATACSFDPELLREIGRALGEECLQEDVSVLLGPGVNIKRSPLCGRNFEYFSEDPHLAAHCAAALIEGVQSVGVGASLKHYAVNNQETRRMTISAAVDRRALREIYLRAFEGAVRESRPWTVMASYNRVNGVYASENKWLLTDVLRDDWGFDGLVMTDWNAMNDRVQAVRAGLDLEMPGCRGRTDAQIVRAVKSGELSETDLDKIVTRVTALLLKARAARRPGFRYDAEAHRALARKAAAASCVLLKNEGGVLPIEAGARVAVIGGFAKAPRYQGAGSSKIRPTALDNAWDELKKLGFSLSYAPGYAGSAPDPALLEEAVAAARGADTALVFAGLPDECESEGFDRQTLDLPESHRALIEAVAAANPRTAVILQLGAPVATDWAEPVKALLVSYLGGQAGGGALADILSGAVCPSGKLAESWPKRLADTPCFRYFPGGPKTVEYRESIFVGYRYYETADVDTAWPFGHGLSYTCFRYDDLNLETKGGAVELSFRVTNTGAVPGAETAQVYVGLPNSTIPRPKKQLAAFQKVRLEPGESAVLRFTLGRDAFAYYSAPAGRWRVEGGVYVLSAGASSRDIRLRAETALAGDGDEAPLAPLRGTAYFHLAGNSFPDADFSLLYGAPLPGNRRRPDEPYTENDILEDLQNTPVGGALLRLFQRYLAPMGPEQAKMALTFLMQMPLRALRTSLPADFPPDFIEMAVQGLNGDTPPALSQILSA